VNTIEDLVKDEPGTGGQIRGTGEGSHCRESYITPRSRA
jgi:hypothetical protein